MLSACWFLAKTIENLPNRGGQVLLCRTCLVTHPIYSMAKLDIELQIEGWFLSDCNRRISDFSISIRSEIFR